jgi:hypothetical protein
MSRLLLACLLLGLCHSAAAETASTASGTRYVVKFKFLKVDQKGTRNTAIASEVAGTKGTPLRTDLRVPNGMVLKLDIREVADSQPTYYVAEFKLIEAKKDGKQKVLAKPTILTAVGCPASLKIGAEASDRIEVNLIVNEKVSAEDGGKKATQSPTKNYQPCPLAELDQTRDNTPPSRIIMGGVEPRIIIQDEEEERLSIPTP